MKILRSQAGALAFKVLMGVFGVVGFLVFVTIAIPNVTICIDRGKMTQVQANVRSLQQATAALTMDTLASGKDGIVWTSMRENGRLRPATLAEFFGALTDRDAYLSKDDLRNLLSAPGFKFADDELLTADRIPIRIFWVDDQSPSDQPLFVTKNWQDGKLTKAVPYGTEGFVFYTKGGGGGVKRKPTNAGTVKNFPAGHDAEGHAYRYVELK